MTKYLIETNSVHRMVYTIESDKKPTPEEVQTMVDSGLLDETGQEWLGEMVKFIQPVETKEFVETFDTLNSHLVDLTEAEKLEAVNVLNEEGTIKDD